MIWLIWTLGRRVARFRRSEEGSATVEFVLVFPLLITVIFSMVEAGWLTTRQMMLERGLDIAVRDLRLGRAAGMTHAGLKDEVCEHAKILINCRRDLILEVVEMDLSSAYPRNAANCIDRTGRLAPKISFNAADRGDIMFVRACMIIDPIMPGLGLGLMLPKDDSGGFQLTTYTAFMNEPA